MYTMDRRLIRSIVAKPFLCARIDMRRNYLRGIDRLDEWSIIIEHRDVWARARRRVA